jgi:hypothetical protein
MNNQKITVAGLIDFYLKYKLCQSSFPEVYIVTDMHIQP